MRRRGFLTTLGALVVSGTVDKLANATPRPQMLASAGPVSQPRQVSMHVEHFRQTQRHFNAWRGRLTTVNFAGNIKH